MLTETHNPAAIATSMVSQARLMKNGDYTYL